jgi:hypothetical protein
MAALANATIRFHTNGNDKDADTHVTIDVTDGNNTLAAHVDNDFGHFDNNSDNGPFGLEIRNPSSNADLERGNVRVRIDPNGHDTWEFNFTLDLQFDDGSHLSGGATGLVLTQDRREQTFGLQGILHVGAV